MISLQQNRYLWVHFAGLAAVPLLLDVCLAGLASSRMAVGTTLLLSPQFWAIALIGIVPTLWMQWQRPFYLFSLVPLALKPAVLSDDQRRCLRLLKSWQIKALAAITAGFSLWVLWQLAEKSLQVMPLTAPAPGLAVATVAFFLFCVFLQVPVSAARLLLVGQKPLQRVAPYEESVIAPNFLILGLRVNRILPVPATLPDVPESRASVKRETESQEMEPQAAGAQEMDVQQAKAEVADGPGSDEQQLDAQKPAAESAAQSVASETPDQAAALSADGADMEAPALSTNGEDIEANVQPTDQ